MNSWCTELSTSVSDDSFQKCQKKIHFCLMGTLDTFVWLVLVLLSVSQSVRLPHTVRQIKSHVTLLPVKPSDPLWPEQTLCLFLFGANADIYKMFWSWTFVCLYCSFSCYPIYFLMFDKCHSSRRLTLLLFDLHSLVYYFSHESRVYLYLRATTCRLSRQVLLPIALLEVHW